MPDFVIHAGSRLRLKRSQHKTVKPHRGVLILVFGILGLVACQLFGIAAWVMGNADLEEMSVGRMDPQWKRSNEGRPDLRNDRRCSPYFSDHHRCDCCHLHGNIEALKS